MNKKEGVDLAKVFAMNFILTSVVNFGVYHFVGYEFAVIFALCWLTGVIAMVAVGIENTINQKS